MSTLRISNIEAKSVPASATVDEKVKITNSSGDTLVFIDGKTSGITTVGINTTDSNITFDANSNVVVTGIITATRFSGEITPTTLNVSGGVGVGDSIFHIGDDNTQIRFPAADTITFETGGSERLRITSAGKVGIGTDLPQEELTIRSSTPALMLRDTDQEGSYTQVSNANQDMYFSANGTSAHANFIFRSGNAGSFLERLRIRSDGKVVIGTNYTGGTLSVTGNLITDDGTNGRITIQADGTSTNQILSTTTGFGSYCNMKYQAADHIFLYGGTERLRITSSGEVAINTTAPVEKLGISGNMRFVNPNGNTSRITALPSGTYSSGTSGGSAICFQRIADGGGGSDEIFFETHWQGNRHGESCRIDKYGNLKFPSGQGIDFSATANAAGGTMNSELLDDYEEGSWIPDVTGRTGGNVAIQVGRYTKVGRMVSIQCHLNIGSLTSSQANFKVNGLPFTSLNTTNNYSVTSSVHFNNSFSIGGDRGLFNGLLGPGTAEIAFYFKSAAAISAVQTSDFVSGNVLFELTYMSL